MGNDYGNNVPGQNNINNWEKNELDYKGIGMDINDESTGQDLESKRDKLQTVTCSVN